MAVTEVQLQNWLNAYGRAWETRDPDAAAALFSEDAVYWQTPFGPPAQGQEGVRTYWAGATSTQTDITFGHEILAVTENRGIARWSAQFMRATTGATVRLDGIFLLDFAGEWVCRSLREWWHQSESSPEDA